MISNCYRIPPVPEICSGPAQIQVSSRAVATYLSNFLWWLHAIGFYLVETQFCDTTAAQFRLFERFWTSSHIKHMRSETSWCIPTLIAGDPWLRCSQWNEDYIYNRNRNAKDETKVKCDLSAVSTSFREPLKCDHGASMCVWAMNKWQNFAQLDQPDWMNNPARAELYFRLSMLV